MPQSFLLAGLRSWFSSPDGLSQRIARFASGAVILVGCLVLIGWSLDLSVLKSVIPGTATMKANTALCFLLAGVSLGLQTRKRRSFLTPQIAQGCTIAVSAIAFLTLYQYFFGWNLGIDELLFLDRPLSPATFHPGRMGINTATNFGLTGAALWLLSRQEKQTQRQPQKRAKVDRIAISQVLATVAGLIALQAVVGYAYNVRVFYQFSAFTTSMSLHTALTFGALCVGILALKSNRGLMRNLTSDAIGGDVARQFIPAAIVVPLVLGWLILQGQQANSYDPNFALSLMSVSLVVISIGLIGRSAVILDRVDRDRKRSSERLRSSEARFRRLASNIPGVIYQYVVHLDGTDAFTYISDRSREIYEYAPEVLMQDFSIVWQMIHPDDVDRVRAANTASAAQLQPFDVEFRLLPPSGKLKWIQVISMPERQPNGGTVWDGIALDISDRVRVEAERKQAQLNEQFLNKLDLRLRQLSDAEAMEWETVRSLGEYLNVDRAMWFEVDWENRRATIYRDWHQEGLPSHAGVYSIADFISPELQAAHLAGESVAISDVTTHPHTAPHPDIYQQLRIGAFANIPCIREGRTVATINVNTSTVRLWRDDEISLMQEIVARLWSLIEQTRAVQALGKSEERLRLALKAAKQGLYDLNVQTGKTIVSPEYAQMLGYDPDTFQETNAKWRERLHPDDWEPVSQVYEEYIAGDRSEYCVEFRQRVQSGDWKWILSLGKIVAWDAEGKPLRMLGTHTDISDRKLAEIALQQQTEELLQASRLKDEFLAALSHELRTPLNPILGWTTMLRGQKLAPAKAAQALETIERNARQQIRLVDDLLDVSRVIQGKLNLEFHPVDLLTIVKSAIDTVQFAAQAKGISIAIQGLPSLTTMGDSDRLQQVFWNLLSNAIKFTPNEGQIEVELAIVPNKNASCYAQVRFTDTGIGIASQFLPHVFENFRQADGSTTRKYGGLGLGLAIVRHLVELHGGTVAAESPGTGQGATFTVKLPLRTVGSALPVNDSLGEAPKNPSPQLPAIPLASQTTPLIGTRIFLVDDDPDNLEILHFLLQENGAEVTAMTSPLKALELIADNPPDLLVSDIGMPQIDGYQLIRKVRALPQGRQIPALALTAFARQEDREEVLCAGFQAYISKPVDPRELLATLTQLLYSD